MRGCRISETACDLKYTFNQNERTYICPCGVCLIKAMCGECCESYLSYVRQYLKFTRSDSYGQTRIPKT